MEREAETVAWGEGRQGEGKKSKKGEREKETKEWCSSGGTWRGETDEQLSVRESPPFRPRGLLLVLPVFHRTQNHLRPKEK